MTLLHSFLLGIIQGLPEFTIADGSFESRVTELLSQWQGNAERKKNMERS